MPIPNTPREVYRNNPLTEVICQVKFPAILQIATVLPAQFQEQLRGRFPHYSTQRESSLIPEQFAELFAGHGGVNHEKLVHQFVSIDRRSMISLNAQFLSLTTSHYERWEDFKASFMNGLELLIALYRPVHFSRIGLRYKDLIDRDSLGLSTAPWSELLNHRLLGPLGEASIESDITVSSGEFRMPVPDVANATAKVRHGIVRAEGSSADLYLVDVDHFVQGEFRHEFIEPTLRTFNGAAGDFFRWAISSRLRDALGAQPS